MLAFPLYLDVEVQYMAQNRQFEFIMIVPFHDLDPMHVVWHGNYLKYFDEARFGLFQAGGIDLYRYSLETNCFFPVTKTSTKHVMPLRYGERIICRAMAVEAWIKIVIDFEIRRAEDDIVCTKGRGEQVAVQHPQMETLYEIPLDVRQALGFE
jgi:acyl-CoA thioester hydrolase